MLRALATARFGTLDHLTRWQDDLLFLRAFPDDDAMHAATGVLLSGIERHVRRLPAPQRAMTGDSGIAGSVSRHTFAWPIARWLVASHAGEVRLDWPSMPDMSLLDGLLRLVVQRAEDDAFESGEWNAREWMDTARGTQYESDVSWLVSRGSASRSAAAFGVMYDAVGVQIRWSLVGSRAAPSNNMLTHTPVHSRRGMRAAPAAPVRYIARALAGIELLPAVRANAVIDVARAALASRCREVEAVSWANPAEVWLADLGEGTAMAIIGTLPERRLSLECNYAYVLFSNGVPIGYGGVTPLFLQANAGINIFGAFRHSEAAFDWAQMLRAFHSLFGVKRFVVNAYQFGDGNDEAIASGAFWFYYRVGFRPVDAEARRLAAAEQVQRIANQAYRSPPETLTRLASGDMHLTMPGFARREFFDERWLPVIAANAARLIAAERVASADAAVARIARRVATTLGADLRGWSAAERAAFARLAPVVAQLPAVDHWPVRDRRAVVALMRSKGASQERDFVRMSHAHPRFFRELIAVARGLHA